MVAHTHEVIGELEALLSTLKDAETGQRGYLLTEDKTYLQPYEDALQKVHARFDRLRKLTSDNSDQQGRLDVLGPKIDDRLDELRQTVALVKNGDRPAALKIVRGDTGKAMMDDLRERVAVMRRAEEELLRRRADESRASFRTTVVSILLPAVIGVVLVCVVFDLSRRNLLVRQRAAQAIADQRERLRVTLASIGDAVITTDGEGLVASLNAVAESLTGWSQDEAVGQPLDAVFRIVNEQTRKGVENPATRALREGVIVGLANHTVLIRKDGTERPIDDSASPIRDGQGHVIGSVLVFRDITARRREEERLREADRRKDEFLAMLAHELRGPLAPLRNMLEVMKRAEGKSDLLRQARDMMERQLAQLVRLVDDLIDVSRISRNKIELRKERVELASVLHQSVEACRPLAECANHQVSVAVPPEPVYLHADPVRLVQVFSNLLNNSCKYTEPGGEIRLTAGRHDGDAVVTVKDTGVGIPPDKLGSVFEMFTQVDRTSERSQGGLGIGLTLVKRLVELHDGTVTAHSEGPGKGSEFVVRLPVLPEQPKRDAPRPAADPAAPSRRILVVDDNPDTASSLAMLLRMTGNETHTAHDGLDAVEAVEKFRPDVVLLDIGLPKLNGLDACRRIRERPWGKNVVIVAVTGWGQDDDRRKSREAGFDGHLVKPVDYDALRKLLAETQPRSE
jgi:PAS domain S-box-containing protein